jgi:tRNA (guanine-N7-)-methyltransferase
VHAQPKALPVRRTLIHELSSIVHPLDLNRVFPLSKPIEVELGSGDGSFLVAYAASARDRNFIGIERLLGRMRKLNRKGERAELTNLAGIVIESGYFLERLLPENSVTALHVYFPDPWPTRKHRRNRLINEKFPTLASRVLQSGGRIYLRTDDQDYYQQMLEVFVPSQLFAPTETPAPLAAIATDFEKEFTARGIKTLRAAYQMI